MQVNNKTKSKDAFRDFNVDLAEGFAVATSLLCHKQAHHRQEMCQGHLEPSATAIYQHHRHEVPLRPSRPAFFNGRSCKETI